MDLDFWDTLNFSSTTVFESSTKKHNVSAMSCGFLSSRHNIIRVWLEFLLYLVMLNCKSDHVVLGRLF